MQKNKAFFTARRMLVYMAFVSVVASGAYWWIVQSTLTGHTAVAIAFTAIMTLAPPLLTAFLVPSTPAGMLLQKINAQTWGFVIVIAASLYLIYYSFTMQVIWWSAQNGAASMNLVYHQAIIGVIATILVPALLSSVVTSEELIERLKQAHMVKRYEIQVNAQERILRAVSIRGQSMAMRGFANLTEGEREEFAAVISGLVCGIDSTLREINNGVNTVSGAEIRYAGLLNDETVQASLLEISETIQQQPGNQAPVEIER